VRNQLSRGWRKLHSEELHNLYSSTNKINEDEIDGPTFHSLNKSSSVCLLISSDLVCFGRVHFCDILPIVKQHVGYHLSISSLFPYVD
jgi:hypothetical protein